MIDIKITYIHHSNFMAELDHTILLSDCFERSIPETGREKPLFMFVGHRHRDHFPRSIFDLEESRGNMTYVLSDDIQTRQVPEDLLGGAVFLGSGEEVSLKDGAGNLVGTQALKSTNEGVAFLASLEHRTICHAGDSSSWVWEGESEADNRRMDEGFHREMDKLAGRHIDVAFMLIDPGQERDFYLGMGDFMRMMRADVVFPIHFWEDFQAVVGFKTLACAGGYKDKIQEVHRRGEEFLV